MSEASMRKCEECVRLREVYWRAINESVRLENALEGIPDGPERESFRMDFEAAELSRITVRDVFLQHKQAGHPDWE